MQELATKLIQTFPDLPHLLVFAQRLLPWLLNGLSNEAAAFNDSRAKALLRAADLLDDPTRHSFMRLMEAETAVLPILDWFRTQVPQRTLYNWQNAAAALVARDLRERSRRVGVNGR